MFFKKNIRSSSMRSILVHQHLGLGDHICCNGLIRALSKLNVFTFLIVKNKFLSNVSKMYRDNPYIKLISYDEAIEKDEYVFVNKLRSNLKIQLGDLHEIELIRIGHNNLLNTSEKNSKEIFYEQFGFSFDDIHNLFYYERDKTSEMRTYNKLVTDGSDYLFIHDDPSRGFKINRVNLPDNLSKIESDMSELVLDHIELLKNAKEIHCIEGAFKQLVDIIPLNIPLYYHDFHGYPLGKTLNKWTIIKY